jgi:hypothetical protein
MYCEILNVAGALIYVVRRCENDENNERATVQYSDKCMSQRKFCEGFRGVR